MVGLLSTSDVIRNIFTGSGVLASTISDAMRDFVHLVDKPIAEGEHHANT